MDSALQEAFEKQQYVDTLYEMIHGHRPQQQELGFAQFDLRQFNG